FLGFFEIEPLQHLLTRLAEQSGYYDTIFFVGTDGGILHPGARADRRA
ncbi:hypothetical protein HOP54_22635, partial [Halomonas daqingensis]|nr:hypothetical protein [Halomonas desiderata]